MMQFSVTRRIVKSRVMWVNEKWREKASVVGLHIDDKIVGLSISQWLPCPLCHLELVVWDGNLVKSC